ncbi:MAG TPA: CBS domain-containing protein [Arachnia sp.]|nr:CBS domain-containing protein [Arachnia sp.]
MKTARDLMTSPAECLAPDETLVDAARMFSKYDVGSMPVVDENTLVGVITDRDIIIEGVSKNLDLADTKISKIMSKNVVTVDVTDDAQAVAQVLADNQIRRVPVMDGHKVVGVVSQADVALELDNATAGEVVEDISKK